MSIGSRLQAAATSLAQGLIGLRLDAAPPSGAGNQQTAVRRDAPSVMDCCGPGLGFGGFGPAIGVTPSLDRAAIDDLYTDQLMRRIVRLIVEDALSVRPGLSGATGELSGCLEYLDERGWSAEAERAMVYSRQYGGGGVICLIDDGRDADEEVDLFGIRDVLGFYAVPKWYLIPEGIGSSRVTAGWYGPRVGRPEHYYVTPNTALTSSGPPSRDLVQILQRSGTRFHRSRVIPWQYVDELDMRMTRWMTQWSGWGPGVVEAVLSPFTARRAGAVRLSAIMNSAVVNVMEMTDLEHRQSTPDLGAAVRARLEFVKACRDFMSDSLPLIATDPKNKFSSLTHQLAGIDKVIEAQRQFLLDVVEYPGVVLFGDSVGGLSGGERGGEWRAYARRVNALQQSWVWTAGSFGGGMRQAVLLAMACPNGPTGGRMDLTVRAGWPSILTETEDDKATQRLKHAQARAQDQLTLGLSADALLRYDLDVRTRYPGLDTTEGPLPVLHGSAPGTEPAQTTLGAAGPATTPGAVNEALAGDQPTDAGPPAALPTDLMTEAEIATALKMTRAAVSKILGEKGVRPFLSSSGLRGGARWSLSQVMAALRPE